ncbi:MAG: 50S ribosomal protein L20 [Patescibacteria group bacterium]|jgi:large subunit ribosomal protein L20
MRVKRGTIRAKKRKNLLKKVKGYRWRRKNILRLAKVATTKAGVYAYRDRRNKKREFRRLWNIQINAGSRGHEISYSKFIHQLKLAQIDLNRKMLADLAENHPTVFAEVVAKAKTK